ncbi:hypothetical protein QFC19_005351 [Naganishia cerealis]|uniref:Uncharacterized protein n=1 Tax=Naganishia cerealis TaxID=610337 RepID=A0ACC2VPF7_9TREE|nr:hypothetical protein QFC19_005351 [Naganishia cerealis]
MQTSLTDSVLPGNVPRTDPEGWRLLVSQDSHGQHKWVYLYPEDSRRETWQQSKMDKYWLGLNTGAKELPKAETPMQAARNGFEFYKQIQAEDGHWAGAYGGNYPALTPYHLKYSVPDGNCASPPPCPRTPSGPLFLIPGLVIGMYVMGVSLRPEQKIEMIRYLLRKRRKEGGWGLHTAAPPTTFGTVMNYVSLRILGLEPDVPVMIETRAWIHKMASDQSLGPSHFYRRRRMCPFVGESLVEHPQCLRMGRRQSDPARAMTGVLGPGCCLNGSLFIPGDGGSIQGMFVRRIGALCHSSILTLHTRRADIPLGYLYGRKFQGEVTPLVEQIRQEIYLQPYDTIDFSQHRNNIHPVDIYNPHHPVLDVLNSVLATYEACAFPPLRRKGLEAAYKLVVYEDENTGYQTVGPVSKMLNMVCRFAAEGRDSAAFKQHIAKIDDFLWMSEEGLMMTGTNGSQLWDIAFISQAVVETGLGEEKVNRESCLRALDWLDKAQIRDNPKWYKEAYRHRSKGAWPFSTPEQSYTVSDCAGEGMKAVLALQSLSYTPQAVNEQRLKDCVDLLLTMQNSNGGFASYELVRGSKKLEWLNTAEVFGKYTKLTELLGD